MRVYIDMEMPKSCRKCMISQPDGCGWVCPIIESKPIVDGRVNSRHPHCPLIEVPEPHGRLIDADALIQDKEVNIFEAVFAVAKAPTIIPASEEGEG